MEEMEMFESSLSGVHDMTELIIRFVFNFVFAMIIIALLYYPKSRKKEYFFTFTVISVSIFFLIFLLGSVKIKVGFALGLFAIFGIIRYRTEQMSVREMTYLFAIIAVSVINALAVTLSYLELSIVNSILIVVIFVGENLPFANSRNEKIVLYDRVDLIVPEKRDELLADLKTRLGINVTNVEIGGVDFLRDTAVIKVYYKSKKKVGNEVDKMLKPSKYDM